MKIIILDVLNVYPPIDQIEFKIIVEIATFKQVSRVGKCRVTDDAISHIPGFFAVVPRSDGVDINSVAWVLSMHYRDFGVAILGDDGMILAGSAKGEIFPWDKYKIGFIEV